MSETMAYTVPGMHCDHCKASVIEELQAVAGVEAVEVDLERKLVVVRGQGLDDGRIRAAIAEAGYETA
ncbi:MAG: cation-transporting ATPase [Thermoleophilia bacterium]